MIDEFPGFREREKKIAEAEKPHMSCGYIALWSVESAARKVRKVSLFLSLTDHSRLHCWTAEQLKKKMIINKSLFFSLLSLQN